MAQYTVNDFKKGDLVYHLSNTKLKMVAVEISEKQNEISCRWIAKNGITQVNEFMPEELGKADDLGTKRSLIEEGL